MSQRTNLWFTKSRRAQSDTDYETWIEGGVVPTLNAFDNGDVRSTTIVFHPHRSDGVRLQGEVISTLTAFMGTGGNNMPMVANIASPLEARFYKGANAESAAGGHLQVFESQVRRLTPVECERLQGFPDDWTEGQSDTNRYKQMGNAVAVPVVEWLIQNICDTI